MAEKMFKDPVMIPVKMERDFKNALLGHCRGQGLMLSVLIRKLLKEYAEKEGIAENEQ